MSETHDLIVIGGGRAAKLAIAAGNAGWKTVLIERDRLGGTCPNRGCVPSKLLIGFAEAARHVREAHRHFIDATFNGIDLQKMFDSVNADIAGVDGRYEKRLFDANVELIRGEARFRGHKRVRVLDRELTAKKIVIATGSRPRPPPFADLGVWTSDDLFPLISSPPRSVILIGGGVVGCELASFLTAVGIDTTFFIRGDHALKKEDCEIVKVFQAEFEKHVRVVKHAVLDDLEKTASGYRARFLVDGKARHHEAERVLFAIGRIPNSESLALAESSITTDDKGFITVNGHLETNVPGIYATGDVNGRFMLLHAASAEVHYLREKFLTDQRKAIDEAPVGHAVYSHPELAAVGMTEEQVNERGIDHVTVTVDWLNSARAEALRIDYPRAKLIVSPKDFSILGCHLVGPEASTLIHEVIAVMKLKNDVRELANLIHVHPALNEVLLAAAVKAIEKIR